MQTTKYTQDFVVIDNLSLSPDFFCLRLFSKEILPPIYPGQFAQVKINASADTYLRIPISIHDVEDEHVISLLIQKIGEGTRVLSEYHAGEKVNIIYPLGKGFRLPSYRGEGATKVNPIAEAKILLIGGGCGIAPLLYLAKILHAQNNTPFMLMGGRTKSQILRVHEFIKYAKLDLSTEDGSMGEKGRITEHSLLQKETFTHIYTCGPIPMMQAVARYAQEHQIACQVSLENTMACGIGACLCCVTPTQNGHRCVCTEGPVFDYQDLKDFI
ncbi:MAG: dihydroorotate dehydrogenase electron transfer subunit [Bacteroidales bacterium]